MTYHTLRALENNSLKKQTKNEYLYIRWVQSVVSSGSLNKQGKFHGRKIATSWWFKSLRIYPVSINQQTWFLKNEPSMTAYFTEEMKASFKVHHVSHFLKNFSTAVGFIIQWTLTNWILEAYFYLHLKETKICLFCQYFD